MAALLVRFAALADLPCGAGNRIIPPCQAYAASAVFADILGRQVDTERQGRDWNMQLTSIRKSLPEEAKYVSKFRLRVAPRLSELETKRYLTPSARRLSSMPEPRRDG